MTARPVPDTLAPAVCFGAVMHARHAPVAHRFAYPLAFVRLPLSGLPSLDVPLLGIDRWNLFSVRSQDHGPRDGSALAPWIRALLARHGLAEACDGEIVLQTLPRLLGYAFNPVSFWFCHDRAGALRAVLAEVNNTFGEHHNYLVHHADLAPIRGGDVLQARKVFHVSPFFPVRGDYRFRFDARGAVHGVAVDYWEDGVCRLTTRLSGRAQPLTGGALARWFCRHPLMTLAVILRIHWQVLRLALARVRFHPKPAPPLEETTR